MSQAPMHEQRRQPERRKKPTSPLSRYTLTGRRTRHRRADDGRQAYVDLYSERSLALILAVLAMSILDGFFTLHLLEAGAREANPIMRYALEYGPVFFLVSKYLLTGAALVLLLIHKEFYLFGGRLHAKYFFLLFLALYFALVIYELVLIFH